MTDVILVPWILDYHSNSGEFF